MAQSAQFEEFRTRYQRAVDSGLVAAAYVYRDEVVQRLMKGYTTGDFVTPNVALKVAIGQPYDANGIRRINAGTNVKYAAYWELGHQNLFTGKFERVEHWRESMMDRGEDMARAFQRAFWRAVQQ